MDFELSCLQKYALVISPFFLLVFLRILDAAHSANQLHWLHLAFCKCVSFSNCNLKCFSSLNSLSLFHSRQFRPFHYICPEFAAGFFPIISLRASNFVKFSPSVIYILQSCSIFRRRFLFHYSAFTPETMARTRLCLFGMVVVCPIQNAPRFQIKIEAYKLDLVFSLVASLHSTSD